MPDTTPSVALRYPRPTEAPDGPGAVSMLAGDTDDRIMRRDTSAAGIFIGQRALVNNIEYRWSGTAWTFHNWFNIDRSLWAVFSNDGYADARGMTDMSVIGGQGVLVFSTTRDAGIAPDQTMLRLAAGLRPAGTIFFDGRAVDSSTTRSLAGFRIESDGTIYLDTATGSNLRSIGGTVTFRIAN